MIKEKDYYIDEILTLLKKLSILEISAIYKVVRKLYGRRNSNG